MTSMTTAERAPFTADRQADAAGRIARPWLIAGMLSSVVYVLADQACAASYPGYRQRDQLISELSAIGAPTAALWSMFMPVFSVLLLAFAVGLVRGGRANGRLRATGWLLVVFICSGPLWAFVPMHPRGAATTWQDAGHLLMGAVSLTLMVVIVATGASALGRRFRAFSLVTGVAVLAAGLATFAWSERVSAAQATPWLGVIERVMLYGFLLWIATLGAVLYRGDRSRADAAAQRAA